MNYCLNNHIINNNVKLKDLTNNYTWIHGNSSDNINCTIFLITIEGKQLKYALDAINNLSLDHNVLINVIMNVAPTNKAYNEMRIRCQTKYFIQLDEDMELFNNAFDIINQTIKSKGKKEKRTYLHVFKLIDEYLGVGDPPVIYGLKVYNNNIMKIYPTYNSGNTSVSSVDQLWHDPINKDGYICNMTNTRIGYHGKHRGNFDLLLRYSKITKNIIEPNLKTNRGHICKILRSINKIPDFHKVYDSLLNHFMILNYDTRIFRKNEKIVLKYINGWVKDTYLDMYKIPKLYTKINEMTHFNFDLDSFFYLFKRQTELDHIYCIIGVLNSMFGQYYYSFDKYPYKLNDYFKRVFTNRNVFYNSINVLEKLNNTDKSTHEEINKFVISDQYDCVVDYNFDDNIYYLISHTSQKIGENKLFD